MKEPAALYACAKCGAQFSKWSGRCTECGAWGSLSGEEASEASVNRGVSKAKPGKPEPFAELSSPAAPKTPTGLPSWDRLLGGGLVAGSVTLLGGEPGIGKSTLVAQLALVLAGRSSPVLYVTGEESPSQVSLRLSRIAPSLPSTLRYLNATEAETVAATIRGERPALTIVDSIQTLRAASLPGEPGNPTQVKAAAALVTEAAKASGAPVVLIGQVTKDGDLAGPRLLEHLVDAVMMMEGDRTQSFRLLRITKNRFGSTDDIALFAMTERGLEEVADASAALIADRPAHVSGTIVSCLADGTRPLLLELQALVAPAGYSTPARRASGIDQSRLNLLLAVLARRAGLGFGDQDVFVNAVGGVEAKSPSVDLALALALASAKHDVPIPPDAAAWGEIGLGGEVRPVAHAERRLKEALRLGFKTLIVPRGKYAAVSGATVVPCATLQEALRFLKLDRPA